MENEIWKPVENYEGLYEVSNLGRIKSLERTVWNKGRGYYKTVPERTLKGVSDKDSYLVVYLCKNGKSKTHKVHRLVAEAFIPNPNNLPLINHKNEDKTDNKVENLEWCSYSYNNTYNDKAKKIGRKLRNDPKRSKPIIGVDKVTGLKVEFPSTMEASRQTGIDHRRINACLKGRGKSAKGFYWHYVNEDKEAK